MATIHPFRACRPPVESVARVAAPPYDVINTKEARALAEGNPDSYLHVSRPEIDLADGVDEHADEVYARGASNLKDLLASGALVQDGQPALYLYAQRMGQHRQLGIVACASVQEYVDDVIKKHEKTRADKEDDRTRHIDELGAHDEPVFLTYRAQPAIDAIVARCSQLVPTYDFTTADDVQHTLWIVPEADTTALAAAFHQVPSLYVADGHHRSAAAARVHALRAGQAGEHDRFLAVLFPHDQMQVLAYNRVVRDPQGRSAAELKKLLEERFDVTTAASPIPTRRRTFCAYLGGEWLTLAVRAGTVNEADPVASLDASICQDQLLEPLFGITDPRTSKSVDFIGGIRGPQELVRRVETEGWSLALHLFPTSVEQLIAVSEAGLLMPPKSTWFEPKLRSGLFLHLF